MGLAVALATWYNKQNVEEEWKGDSGSAEEMERIVYKAYQM